MATRLSSDALCWLQTLYHGGSLAEMSDGQLLERFLTSHGAASEAAFEVLVRRHGPPVLSLCRGVLQDDHAAADAFQATFIVLASRAATIREGEQLAPWLGRVARRIARSSRKSAARRDARERRVAVNEGSAASADVEFEGLEVASLVSAEVDRLPKVERLLLRLIYWQGKTYEEAAALLSWPIGTVRSRLARVRDRLRGRLTRRGLGPMPAVTGSAAVVKETSAATLPEALVLQTVRAATGCAGTVTVAVEASLVPATVAALVDGELSTMATISWKSIAVLLLLGGAMVTGVVSRVQRGSGSGAGASKPETPAIAAAPAAVPVQLASQGKADGRSLLTNGGVEEGVSDSPRAWTVGDTIPGVAYIWSRDTGHTGKASLCLKKTAQRYFPIAQWSQEVNRGDDTPRLKVSAWVKAQQAAKAILDAQFIDGDGNWTHAWVAYIGARKAKDPPVSHDWKRYEGIVAIPPKSKRIVIAAQIYGPGMVWFDDLDAEYTHDPSTDPLAP
jgi:RNA polymerase sigma-70 factor (ECF subfamily)